MGVTMAAGDEPQKPTQLDSQPPPSQQQQQLQQGDGNNSVSVAINDAGGMMNIIPIEEDALKRPSWFTPIRLLVIFCVINMLNYVDRGAIASNGVNGSQRTCDPKGGVCKPGSGIQGQFNLSNFEDGVLSSAFMVGLLIASPIFASLAKTHNPFRLIGVGLSVWTLATAGCGASFNFWTIAICRMLVGVGEASFISLAAPFIDDNAPAAKKTAWLAIFYMCIPTGIAVGYVYGGLVAKFSWRYAFFGESILMLPFAVLGFVMKPLPLKGFAAAVESKKQETTTSVDTLVHEQFEARGGAASKNIIDQISRFFKDMKVLLLDKVYVINVIGYISYNFVIGAYSYWGPKAGYGIYHMNNPDMVFGGITVVCGIVGTLAGGYILDRMNSTISNAFKILSAATFLGAIFCFGAFCSKSMYVFIALFAIGELLVFATQGPVNFVCLHCVNPSMRPISMAMSTVAIHIFGDVPSSPLVGAVQDHIKNWRKTTLILTSVLFLAAAIWFAGIFLHSVDKSNEESEHSGITIEKSNQDFSIQEPAVEESIYYYYYILKWKHGPPRGEFTTDFLRFNTSNTLQLTRYTTQTFFLDTPSILKYDTRELIFLDSLFFILAKLNPKPSLLSSSLPSSNHQLEVLISLFIFFPNFFPETLILFA